MEIQSEEQHKQNKINKKYIENTLFLKEKILELDDSSDEKIALIEEYEQKINKFTNKMYYRPISIIEEFKLFLKELKLLECRDKEGFQVLVAKYETHDLLKDRVEEFQYEDGENGDDDNADYDENESAVESNNTHE